MNPPSKKNESAIYFVTDSFFYVADSLREMVDSFCFSPDSFFFGLTHHFLWGFASARIATNERQILADMGHPQPPTPIFCDNEVAIGLATDSINLKMSKSSDRHAMALGQGSHPTRTLPRRVRSRHQQSC